MQLAFIAVIIAIWVSGTIFPALGTWHCSSCDIKYEAVGCYADARARPLQHQVLNERDPRSKVFGNRRIDWLDWNNYMTGFACRCAKIVKAKGWSVFGVQFYGECWSGPTGEARYSMKGESDKCIGPNYKPCGILDKHCAGKLWTNFVYRIVPGGCDLKFEKLGCFADVNRGPRLLPNYIMTDRQKNLKIFSGQRIDWRNWDVYMPEFVCRCAKKAKESGYHIFGVQYYGECWSGINGDVTYAKKGKSGRCINSCFEKCKPFSKFCAGSHFANTVYRFSDEPCEVPVEAKGCYAENPNKRALRIALIDQVDPSSPAFNGFMFDFENWEEEFSKLLCRCARAAKSRGFSEFGVNDQGSCWSDRYFANRFDAYGGSQQCYTHLNRSCDGKLCAGGYHANFVYQIANKGRRSEIPLAEDFMASTDDDSASYLTEDEPDEAEVPSEMIQPTNEPFPTDAVQAGMIPEDVLADFYEHELSVL